MIARVLSGLRRAGEGLRDRLGEVLRPGRPIDAAALGELEEALLEADVGVDVAAALVASLRDRAGRENATDAAALRRLLAEEIVALFPAPGEPASPPAGPRVTLLLGVNGGGKTTTAGKLAARHAAAGRSVVVAAADTYRAAAVDQVARWAERAGAHLVRGAEGADPSSVLHDALRAALARAADEVVADTAGRLHTRRNLMDELAKMARICAREVEGAPHETFLVLDATTGQNGLAQARAFSRAARLTGVVLTKLDGTARGGIAVAIGRELGVPLRYVGVGEGPDDLLDVEPGAFVAGLLATDEEIAARARS